MTEITSIYIIWVYLWVFRLKPFHISKIRTNTDMISGAIKNFFWETVDTYEIIFEHFKGFLECSVRSLEIFLLLLSRKINFLPGSSLLSVRIIYMHVDSFQSYSKLKVIPWLSQKQLICPVCVCHHCTNTGHWEATIV